MAKPSMFVGMDVNKDSTALAEDGCGGEVRHYGWTAGDLVGVATEGFVELHQTGDGFASSVSCLSG